MFKKILAGILDFITVFFGLGFIIAAATGNMKGGSFSLEGWTAALLFALVIAYFVAGRFVGGTIWQRILGTRRS
jgi:hypothetical protein